MVRPLVKPPGKWTDWLLTLLKILIIVIAFRVCNVDFSACESAADSDAFI
jgi:hypothetical protein